MVQLIFFKMDGYSSKQPTNVDMLLNKETEN